MCKAIDVANFFVDMANNDPNDCMTNLRVNKLLYFAQAWSLVRRGKGFLTARYRHGSTGQ